jgi:hypothetical protein
MDAVEVFGECRIQSGLEDWCSVFNAFNDRRRGTVVMWVGGWRQLKGDPSCPRDANSTRPKGWNDLSVLVNILVNYVGMYNYLKYLQRSNFWCSGPICYQYVCDVHSWLYLSGAPDGLTIQRRFNSRDQFDVAAGKRNKAPTCPKLSTQQFLSEEGAGWRG